MEEGKEKERTMTEQHFLMWISREIYDYDKFLMPFFLTHTKKETPKLHFSLLYTRNHQMDVEENSLAQKKRNERKHVQSLIDCNYNKVC